MKKIITMILVTVSGLMFFFGKPEDIMKANFMMINAVFLIVSTKD
jgi:hypothetical protein